MKEIGTAHWTPQNTGATNLSRFTALPGGLRANSFLNISSNGYWWSSESNTTLAWYQNMAYLNDNTVRNTFTKFSGLSVRCVRD